MRICQNILQGLYFRLWKSERKHIPHFFLEVSKTHNYGLRFFFQVQICLAITVVPSQKFYTLCSSRKKIVQVGAFEVGITGIFVAVSGLWMFSLVPNERADSALQINAFYHYSSGKHTKSVNHERGKIGEEDSNCNIRRGTFGKEDRTGRFGEEHSERKIDLED